MAAFAVVGWRNWRSRNDDEGAFQWGVVMVAVLAVVAWVTMVWSAIDEAQERLEVKHSQTTAPAHTDMQWTDSFKINDRT